MQFQAPLGFQLHRIEEKFVAELAEAAQPQGPRDEGFGLDHHQQEDQDAMEIPGLTTDGWFTLGMIHGWPNLHRFRDENKWVNS